MASDKLRGLYKALLAAKKILENDDNTVELRTNAANEVLRLDREISELEESEGKYSNKYER